VINIHIKKHVCVNLTKVSRLVELRNEAFDVRYNHFLQS